MNVFDKFAYAFVNVPELVSISPPLRLKPVLSSSSEVSLTVVSAFWNSALFLKKRVKSAVPRGTRFWRALGFWTVRLTSDEKFLLRDGCRPSKDSTTAGHLTFVQCGYPREVVDIHLLRICSEKRWDLFFANLVKQDPGRARQNR